MSKPRFEPPHISMPPAPEIADMQRAIVKQQTDLEMALNKSPGLKYDTGKPPYDLLDYEFLDQVANVLEYGRHKYAAHNWRKGIQVSRNLAAAIRHISMVVRGEDIDPESGLPHLAHAVCCVMFAWWTIKHRADFDDRWKP